MLNLLSPLHQNFMFLFERIATTWLLSWSWSQILVWYISYHDTNQIHKRFTPQNEYY